MTPEAAKILREAFPAEKVGRLPRVTCKACSENKQDKHCAQHQRTKCAECGSYITTAHIHLDYVGHAAVTDRLLQADNEWTYELCRDPNGLPFTVTAGFSDPMAKVGLWIELVLAGTRTPGFGEGKNFKEAISDAIRNAAMRRGVALDLWSKEDLHADGGEPRGSTGKPGDSAAAAQSAASPPDKPTFTPPPSAQVADPHGLQSSRADADPGDDGQPGNVQVFFGKNAGQRLVDLTPKQRQWYATEWHPDNPQYPVGPKERRLRQAARQLCGTHPVVETDGVFATAAAPDPDADIPF